MAEAGKPDTEDLFLQIAIEEELLKLIVEDLKKFGKYMKKKEEYDGKSKLKDKK